MTDQPTPPQVDRLHRWRLGSDRLGEMDGARRSAASGSHSLRARAPQERVEQVDIHSQFQLVGSLGARVDQEAVR